MKRVLAVLSAAAMLFCSCAQTGGNPDEVPQEAGAQSPVTPAAEEAAPETELTADLPEADYEGYVFTFLTQTNYNDNFRLDMELNGEALNDAACQRNDAVADRFNVDFEVRETDDVASTLRNAVSAGDSAYGMVLPHATVGVAAMASAGALSNINELPYTNYAMPWWNGRMKDALAIRGKSYYASGDLVMTWQGMLAILFNKELLEELGVDEDLYAAAEEGRWTMDKMLSLAELGAADLNGDGTMDGSDRYGYLGNKNTGYGTQIACGVPFTERDEEGTPVLAFNTDRMTSVVEKYYALTHSPATWLDEYSSVTYATSAYRSMLIEGRSFLTELDIGGLYSYLREIEFNFGILPLPKLDEEQESYRVFCGAGLIGLPSNAEDPERTGAIWEALAYYSYKFVRPAFFDIVLENKAVRDQESYRMITLMHENKTFDFGFNFDSSGSIYGALKSVVITGNGTDFASFYQKQQKVWTKTLNKVYESFGD